MERCVRALWWSAVLEGSVALSLRRQERRPGRREVEIGPRRAAVGRQTRKDEHEVGFSMMHGW